MEFITNEKLTIVGAAGMIGSNMAQTAMMLHLTPNICLYDPFAPALEGVAEELYHCAFEHQGGAERRCICRIVGRRRPQGRHDA